MGAAPPLELVIANRIDRWGYRAIMGDQPMDWFEMTRMTELQAICDVMKKYRSLKGADIHKLTLDERDVIQDMINMGFEV